MPNPTVEIKLEDVLISIQKDLKEIRDDIQKDLKEIRDDLTDLKVSQAEIRGDIKVLDEKVTGIGKRLENQEFVSKGILGGLLLIVLGGAAKYFGFVPKPISHKLRSKSSCQGSLEEKIVTSFLPFRKRCNN
ncbi:MAG: hypothetical protein ACKO2V_15375 [Snowella sp.]